ncbi:hypothetical protein Pst134EB_001297 [Puccinia striiformis f. sp. tritici]|nr:hypothetical protein Pst134EB_001297 [Puccinia striiformis f. sp. tritici]
MNSSRLKSSNIHVQSVSCSRPSAPFHRTLQPFHSSHQINLLLDKTSVCMMRSDDLLSLVFIPQDGGNMGSRHFDIKAEPRANPHVSCRAKLKDAPQEYQIDYSGCTISGNSHPRERTMLCFQLGLHH